MRTRFLGEDKLEVSAIGLGCMGFTQSYPPYPDRKNAIETIRKAVARRWTWALPSLIPPKCTVTARTRT